MIRALLVALLPLGVWCHAHPRAAVLIGGALVLATAAVIKACRDFGPPLAVASWGHPARPPRCPSCGWA